MDSIKNDSKFSNLSNCTCCKNLIKSERDNADYECLETNILFMPGKINPNDCKCDRWVSKGSVTSGRTVCQEHECSE